MQMEWGINQSLDHPLWDSSKAFDGCFFPMVFTRCLLYQLMTLWVVGMKGLFELVRGKYQIQPICLILVLVEKKCRKENRVSLIILTILKRCHSIGGSHCIGRGKLKFFYHPKQLKLQLKNVLANSFCGCKDFYGVNYQISLICWLHLRLLGFHFFPLFFSFCLLQCSLNHVPELCPFC